jgi:predicted alpha/beta-fold hydrolase
MTMWGKFFRRSRLTAVQSRVVETPDGDQLTIAYSDAPADGPRLLLLHGLEGGVRSHYVGGIWARARERGWQPNLLLFRTCDGKMNLARRTYHSGETSDLGVVVRRFIEESPDRPICLVGVSLGGNVLLKWLGEESENVPSQVRGAAAVSTPFDLARSSRAIGTGFARVYEWNFLRSLKRKAAGKLGQYPDVCDSDAVNSIESMWEFDDRFTAPLHGFADAADYYDRCSSIRFLKDIRRPTLLLSAYDDPFYSAGVLGDVTKISETNPDLTLEFHRHGGHVGFVGGVPWRPTYYVETRVTGFLAGHVDTDHRHHGSVVGA